MSLRLNLPLNHRMNYAGNFSLKTLLKIHGALVFPKAYFFMSFFLSLPCFAFHVCLLKVLFKLFTGLKFVALKQINTNFFRLNFEDQKPPSQGIFDK